MGKLRSRVLSGCFMLSVLLLAGGCAQKAEITSLPQLADKSFAVPTGTAADTLVLSKFPQAKFQYFNTVLDAALAVKAGKADAVAYDEPILKNIAAKNDGLKVLPEMITVDNYGFAVSPENRALKVAIDAVVKELRQGGGYDEMQARWFPKKGNPAAMPEMPLDGAAGVLKLGTAAVTEPLPSATSPALVATACGPIATESVPVAWLSARVELAWKYLMPDVLMAASAEPTLP